MDLAPLFVTERKHCIISSPGASPPDSHRLCFFNIRKNYKHILKNALIPIVTVISFSLAGMLTTGFITERLLGIPGVGDFAIQSVFNRDYPVIMAFTLILSVAFVVANLIADIAYSFIDPRIRFT